MTTDAKTLAIKLIVEALTGRKIKVLSLEDLQQAQAGAEAISAETQQATQQQQAPQRAGWGVEYEFHETYSEVEQTSFSAEGVVKTADGQQITFQYELEMDRQFHSETPVSVRAGDALRLAIEAHAHTDTVAERALALGGAVDGSLQAAAEASPLPAISHTERNATRLLEQLLERLDAGVAALRSSMDASAVEPNTQDVYVEILRALEKDRWMLQAHLS